MTTARKRHIDSSGSPAPAHVAQMTCQIISMTSIIMGRPSSSRAVRSRVAKRASLVGGHAAAAQHIAHCSMNPHTGHNSMHQECDGALLPVGASNCPPLEPEWWCLPLSAITRQHEQSSARQWFAPAVPSSTAQRNTYLCSSQYLLHALAQQGIRPCQVGLRRRHTHRFPAPLAAVAVPPSLTTYSSQLALLPPQKRN
jgi:hypothetical protein